MITDIDATGTPVKVLYDVIGELMKLDIYAEMAGKKA